MDVLPLAFIGGPRRDMSSDPLELEPDPSVLAIDGLHIYTSIQCKMSFEPSDWEAFVQRILKPLDVGVRSAVRVPHRFSREQRWIPNWKQLPSLAVSIDTERGDELVGPFEAHRTRHLNNAITLIVKLEYNI